MIVKIAVILQMQTQQLRSSTPAFYKAPGGGVSSMGMPNLVSTHLK